jgi:hypothetical protein
MTSPHRQRGWIGLVGIVLALVIVAVVAKTALKQYGLLDSAKAPTAPPAAASEAERAAAVTPRNALERARGVQDMVRQGAIDQQKSIDDAIPK